MNELRDKNGLTEAEFLAAYHPGDWPHPSVTADNVLLSKEEDGCYVLLIRRGGHPCLGRWALPGGFVDYMEPPYRAARRELQEETCLEHVPAVLLGVFGDPDRDPRGWTITCAYAALVDRKSLAPKAADDAQDARWFRMTCERSGDRMTVQLTNEDTVLTSVLQAESIVSPLGTERQWSIIENDGLAFDHAKVLATAADRFPEVFR